MRTTNEIICAVKDCQPATEQELRLALCAMESIKFFVYYELANIIDAVEKDTSPKALKFRAKSAFRLLEDMFQAAKTPPDKWLGPAHTPGTPENKEQVRMARVIFKKATGKEL